VNIILATEVSEKARGSIQELATASKMMFLAKRRVVVPKDLGIDLLRLKEKRSREETSQPLMYEGIRSVQAGSTAKYEIDSKGYIRIIVDRAEGEIVAIHYPRIAGKPDVQIRGKDASKIARKIIELGLISRLDHAAYLGAELQKAETCLKIGRSYVQDAPLFPWAEA